MSDFEYWDAAAGEISDALGLDLSVAQCEEMAKMIDQAADVKSDYMPPVGGGTNTYLEEKEKRIAKLEQIVSFLAHKLGVTVNEHSMEIEYMTQCGPSHMASSSERIS